jgi:hypothetical protein
MQPPFIRVSRPPPASGYRDTQSTHDLALTVAPRFAWHAVAQLALSIAAVVMCIGLFAFGREPRDMADAILTRGCLVVFTLMLLSVSGWIAHGITRRLTDTVSITVRDGVLSVAGSKDEARVLADVHGLFRVPRPIGGNDGGGALFYDVEVHDGCVAAMRVGARLTSEEADFVITALAGALGLDVSSDPAGHCSANRRVVPLE